MLADYRLLALVGQGEYAQVYCAVHRRSGRLVAIKQIRHVREIASQESVIMRRLKHPNVLSCRAIAQDELSYLLVLDYCEAGTLRSLLNGTLKTATPFSLPETKALIGDLLLGLSYLHQRGIVHDDLKPENIFLTYLSAKHHPTAPSIKTPSVKIGDFGSAHFVSKSNRSLREVGSPTYTAPERFEGQASPAADLYSVGVMLYELLTGDRPFSGSAAVLKKAHQKQSVHFPPSLNSAAQRLLSVALHKQPQQRFATAADMLVALQSLPAATDPSALPALPVTLPSSSLSQTATSISSYGITAPVESLITVPQGCCLITSHALHLLTHRKELLSIARFRNPCWITVSPTGRWFVALSKKTSSKRTPLSKEQQNSVRISQGMVGAFSARSGHQRRRSITLTGPLLTALCANVLQVIAIDNRYLLRVSTTKTHTHLECFTRRGQFVGEISLNMRLIQVVPTAEPYQLIGLRSSANPFTDLENADVEGAATQPAVVLITLKPLQINAIRLPIIPERVSALPWGYFVSYQRQALLLDKSADLISQLTQVPQSAAIASITPSTLLFASNKSSYTSADSTTVEKPPATSCVSLLAADVNRLDLGMIF